MHLLEQSAFGGKPVQVRRHDVLAGCVSQGKDMEEAKRNIIEAAEGVISVRRELGLPDTEPMQEVEVAL